MESDLNSLTKIQQLETKPYFNVKPLPKKSQILQINSTPSFATISNQTVGLPGMPAVGQEVRGSLWFPRTASCDRWVGNRFRRKYVID